MTSPSSPAQEETLHTAFAEYGNVQHVKVIKDKGGELFGFDPPPFGLLHPAGVGHPGFAAAEMHALIMWMSILTRGLASGSCSRSKGLDLCCSSCRPPWPAAIPARLTPENYAHDTAVAYVKFDKASSAALAMEHLNGAVLNDGRGPKLKVLLAEEPTQR